jgi:hypothetical protein
MPYLVLKKLNKNDEKEQKLKPIAIVKSEKGEADKFHNMFLYLDMDEKPNQDKKTSVELPFHCKFEILPNTNPNKRDVFYLAGASGSGKSYLCKQIIDNYCLLYPKRKIFIVSKLEEDDTLDSIKSKNIIKLDHTDFVENPPNINDDIFYESFVIFDDIDCIDDKAQDKAINTFMNDIAVTGRKHKHGQGCISLAFISHYLSNYKKTRLILNEATHYCLYPQSTATNQLYYLLNKYLGMTRDEIRHLKKLGRWVCIFKNYPQFLISQYTAKILNTD